MAMVNLEINGRKITARPEATILEVVAENKLDDIPTLCHSPELKPYGSCFLCVVEVAGRPNLVPACATRVAEVAKIAKWDDAPMAYIASPKFVKFYRAAITGDEVYTKGARIDLPVIGLSTFS